MESSDFLVLHTALLYKSQTMVCIYCRSSSSFLDPYRLFNFKKIYIKIINSVFTVQDIFEIYTSSIF